MPTATIRVSRAGSSGSVTFDFEDPYQAREVTYDGALGAWLLETLNTRETQAYNPRNDRGPAPKDFFWCQASLEHLADRVLPDLEVEAEDAPEVEVDPEAHH